MAGMLARGLLFGLTHSDKRLTNYVTQQTLALAKNGHDSQCWAATF
jgi:hypothetical protein